MGHLIHAGRALMQDLLPTVVFAVLVALKVDVLVATLCAAGISVAQLLLQMALRRPIAPLQWAGLGLVVVFGTAGVLAHDARFLMVKPTLVYSIVGAVMLKRGWMLRYLPPVAAGHADGPMIAFGYVWAGLMFVTAAANLVIAVGFTPLWPAFLAVFPLASKLGLFAVQFLTVRFIARRRILSARALEGQAPQAA